MLGSTVLDRHYKSSPALASMWPLAAMPRPDSTPSRQSLRPGKMSMGCRKNETKMKEGTESEQKCYNIRVRENINLKNFLLKRRDLLSLKVWRGKTQFLMQLSFACIECWLEGKILLPLHPNLMSSQHKILTAWVHSVVNIHLMKTIWIQKYHQRLTLLQV